MGNLGKIGRRFICKKMKPVMTLRSLPSLMRGWQLESLSGIGALNFREDIDVPILTTPNDVLVKVEASSVNPLDVMMTKGYGNSVLSNLRSKNNDLILGRDFSGTVMDVGMTASNEYRIGDEVWGATFPSSQGSHADFVTASTFTIAKKPKNLKHIQASAIPFTGLTAWSSMMVSAGLSSENLNRNTKYKILVIGASGGVGTFAVQLLKSLNYSVVAVCENFGLLEKLGADVVLDHNDLDYFDTLRSLSSFDVMFDFAGLGNKSVEYMELLRPWSNAKLVTLMSPLLKSTDQDGIFPGTLKTLAELATKNINTVVNNNGCTFRYGYFMPNPYALKSITKYVENGKIRPIIQEVFKLEHLIAGYEAVEKGNLNGKIVVDHKN